ncbi:unnamed protein product [Didymodactylos carnosus]|uniref:F-box domain-containing protein n=1 Tax=Didymodactylos carnosus TaxID=1234261 RepID=A0A814DQC5_9BILA|nr:unnamed protein product [Didymodactylos carnosus]CAF1061491.1 unnamed protein product [Didymodactylos carnosus]CAF3734954.1 unnamed protein product [Didymodactylos carnosus]CAF3826992.1 unnamed protein product [Didymodactylos carnosus]
MVTRLESLPTELFFELFQYLSSIDLYRSLYNLNTYINSLLYHIEWKINLLNVSIENDQILRHYLIPIFSKQITSVKISMNDYESYLQLIQFVNLKYLKLVNLTVCPIHIFSSFNHLSSLDIFTYEFNDNFNFGAILSISTLKRCSLSTTCFFTYSNLTSPSSTSNLIYLNINQCSLNDLYVILKHVQKLKYLIIQMCDDIIETFSLSENFILPSLIYFKLIVRSYLKFEELEQLLMLSFITLKHLIFYSTISEFTNSKKWINLLMNLNNLKIFECFMSQSVRGIDEQERQQIQQSFQTSYWLNWNLTCDYNNHILRIYTSNMRKIP